MFKYFQIVALIILSFATNGYAQKTIFWEIKDTVNNTTSYLLGTNHLIGASFIESFSVIDSALRGSSIAIFESVKEGGNSRSTISAREKSDSIQIILSKEEYSFLKSLNISNEDNLHKYEPYELQIILFKFVTKKVCDNYTQSDSLIQLDDYLELKSRKCNVPVMGLETSLDQVKAIGEEQKLTKKYWIFEKKNIKDLLKIARIGKYNTSLCDIHRDYKNLKFTYNFDKKCPDDILLKKRNEKWIPKIISELSSKNCFIAVGFGHLKYDCGLIVELRKKGYIITPINLR